MNQHELTQQSPSTSFLPELLSPAGNWDCARAAVANGADAIYFGLQGFNARMRADNFTMDDLPALMRYLHSHGVRGFVTMNTLIFCSELEAAERQLRKLAAAGVDAIIVQDLGLAWLSRQVAPEMELHASTQMTVTSPEGYRFLDSLFRLDRVVLARELSLKEMKRFPKEAPMEVFVHGALCVAYSGQCLTSESLGQRSANRGECAQACRMPYELVVDGVTWDLGERRYLLSPQDLAAVDVVDQLVEQGVASYKIEGRLKSPDYVAAVTSVYRKALDAAIEKRAVTEYVTERERYALEMTFSRGLTTGWLEGTNHPRLTHGRFGKKRGVFLGEIAASGPGWIELVQWPDVPLQAEDGVVFDAGEERNQEQGGRIWKIEGRRVRFHRSAKIRWNRVKPGQRLWKTDDPTLNAEVRELWKHAPKDVPRKPLRFILSGQIGEPVQLECGTVFVESSVRLETAQHRPLTDDVLLDKLGRLGTTEYYLEHLENKLPENVTLPLSALNRLRRALIAQLEATKKAELQSTLQSTFEAYLPSKTSSVPGQAIHLLTLCRTMEQVDAALDAQTDALYIDFEDIKRYKDVVVHIRAKAQGTPIFLATPRIQKAGEAPFFKMVERAEPDGVLIRNLGAIEFFQHRSDLQLIGDFSLNVANPLTARVLLEHSPLHHLTVSYDLNIEQALDLVCQAPSDWFEMTLHQHMPMFHMEHCVFCTFMSEGTSIKDCGKPCENHEVYLRDRVGQMHRLHADVGCRNTLFNGRAQTGARYFQKLHSAGMRRFRVEFLDESKDEATHVLQAYKALFAGQTDGHALWNQLGVLERLGVTEGSLVQM